MATIPGCVGGMTYWLSGMTKTVNHANGIVDTYQIDTNTGMGRPQSIAFGIWAACTPPSITVPLQPQTQSQPQAQVVLSVGANGTAPLSYKWFQLDANGVPQEIPSSTCSFVPSQTARYFVRISRHGRWVSGHHASNPGS